MGKLVTMIFGKLPLPWPNSIRMILNQENLKAMMSKAGFARVTYHNMTGGVVGPLHRGHQALMPHRPLLSRPCQRSLAAALAARRIRLERRGPPAPEAGTGKVILIQAREPQWQFICCQATPGA